MTQSKKLLVGQRVMLLLSDGVPRNAAQVSEQLEIDIDLARARLTTLSRRRLARDTHTYALTTSGAARAGQLAEREESKRDMAEKAAARAAAKAEKNRAAEPVQRWVSAAAVRSVGVTQDGIWGGLVGATANA